MNAMQVWERELEEVMPRVRAWRRALHQNPERSGQEEQTRTFLLERLKEMGIPNAVAPEPGQTYRFD